MKRALVVPPVPSVPLVLVVARLVVLRLVVLRLVVLRALAAGLRGGPASLARCR